VASLIYYEHYYCSRNDVKIIKLNRLLKSHGSKLGYALYHATLEVMLELDGFVIDRNDIDMVAVMVQESVTIYEQFVNHAISLDLLSEKDGKIYSERFLEWALRKSDIRSKNAENGRLGGRPRKDIDHIVDDNKMVTDHIAEPSKLIEPKLSPISEDSVTKLNPNDKPVLPNKSLEVKGVFDHWNSKGIKVHREISETLKNAIKNALKKFQADQICGAIDAYAHRLQDSADFFSYRWTLLEFLTRKNALPVFAELSQNTEQVKQQKAQEAVKSQSCEAQKRLDESALVSELSSRLWADFGDLRELLSHLWKFPTPESKMSYIETMPARLQAIVTAPDSQPLRVMRQGVNQNLAKEYETIKTQEMKK